MNWSQLYPIIDKKFNAERCLDRVRAIYGTDRWNDFSVYEETAEYCARSMENAGLEQIEKLPLKADGKTLYGDWNIHMAWKVHHGKLWYADGEPVCDYHKVPCSLTMYSPSTSGPVEAEVVDVTDWAELPKDGSLAGKILLTDKRAAGIYADAAKAGAIGILSDQMMLYPGVRDSRQELYDECPWDGLSHRDPSNRLFAFKLTPRQADTLREKLKQEPVRMIADVKTESYEGVNYTVSGALMGADPTAPEVFAYAHLYEPGANDNASGSAALLELAECFREAIEEGLLPRPKRTIRFAMGRECAGSMGYMTCHPEKDFLCAGVFDMVGTEKIDRATLSVRYDPISNWSFADAAIRASVRLYEQYSGNATNFQHNHFRLRLGTGSSPPRQKGLHRSTRHPARPRPITIPHSITASMQYWEQVGVKRQLPCPFSGERKRRYRYTGMSTARQRRLCPHRIHRDTCRTRGKTWPRMDSPENFFIQRVFPRLWFGAGFGQPPAYPAGTGNRAGLVLHPAFSLPQPSERGLSR